MLITHHWPPKGSAGNCQLHLAKYCGIAVAPVGNHRSLYCIQTFEHLLRGHRRCNYITTFGLKGGKSKSVTSLNTSHLSRESKYNDVIKCPAVFWVWGVKGQLPGGFFPEVYEEGGVDHWNCKTSFAYLLPNGYVGWGTLIVTLVRQA